MRVYDYVCPLGHRTEHFTRDAAPTAQCACGETSTRALSAPNFILEGHSGSFPGRAMKWEREHEKAGRQAVE